MYLLLWSIFHDLFYIDEICIWHVLYLNFSLCSALVEVKPILFVPEDTEIEFEDTEIEIETNTQDSLCTTFPSSWSFENVPYASSCVQKYVIQNKICVVALSVMNQHAAKICSDSSVSKEDHGDHQYFCTQMHMKQIARFCIYLLDKTLMENCFSWGDIMVSFFPPQIAHCLLCF